MGEFIAMAIQKGGSGKTTSTVNLAAICGKRGRTLVIDADPQGNAGLNLGIPMNKLLKAPTVFDVFTGKQELKNVIIGTKFGVDIIPANPDLAEFDLWTVEEEQFDAKKPQFWFRDLLGPLRDKYDYIYIDCPPSLGLLTLNAFVLCDSVLIPIECEVFAQAGLLQLWSTIQKTKKLFNPNLNVRGIFFTKFNSFNLTTIVSQEVGLFADKNGIKVYTTPIRRSVAIGNSLLDNPRPAVVANPKAAPSIDYFDLAKEVFG